MLVVSNYGLRFIQHVADNDAATATERRQCAVLLELLDRSTQPDSTSRECEDELLRERLVETVSTPPSPKALSQRYAHPPLENVRRVVFELTRRCNLRCLHCRNGYLKPSRETQLNRLLRAAQAMIRVGITRFDFIGGEVTAFGEGWLDLVRQLRSSGAQVVGVITNGWFLQQQGFIAAGRRYADDREYLATLKEHGLTHIIFSVDGPESVHDQWRRQPGLYRRILSGFDTVRQTDLEARVSLVIRDGIDMRWLGQLAERLYIGTFSMEGVARILTDDTHYVSRLIDIGRAGKGRRGLFTLTEPTDELLRCKNYFRPCPGLRIQASGEISLCPLVDAGEGYGNINDRDLVDIINDLHHAFIYQLHSQRKIAAYRKHLDPAIVGERFDHVCTLRAMLTLLARALHQHDIGPEDTPPPDLLRRINSEIAHKVG